MNKKLRKLWWKILVNIVAKYFIAKPDSWMVACRLCSFVFILSEEQTINLIQINNFFEKNLYCINNQVSISSMFDRKSLIT